MNEIDFSKYINNSEVVIDLGCGTSKKAGAIGIDILPIENVDIVANIDNGLQFIPDNTVDKCYSSHFLEHVNNFELLVEELYRIMKPEGVMIITVPHFSNPYFYSDYTHKRFFGLYTFNYFSNSKDKYRNVPKYNSKVNFEIVSRKLVFKTSIFKINSLFRKWILTPLINSSSKSQEIYEGFFTKSISCSEITYILKAIK